MFTAWQASRRGPGFPQQGIHALLLAALLVLSPASGLLAQPSQELPWKDDQTISRVSVDDDIRSVLRAVLQAGGFSAIFRPGVDGTISMRLDRVPAGQAFEQLIAEQGLDYEYRPETRTVIVYPLSAAAIAPPRRVFITTAYADFAAVERVLERFDIGDEGITFDRATRTIAIVGRGERVEEVSELIRRIEETARERHENNLEQEQRDRRRRRAEIESRLYEELLASEVQVIPLRFASVGQTTRQFQGRSVTVPGILNTLEAIIGTVNVDAGGGALPSRPAAEAGNAESEQEFLLRMQRAARPTISADVRTNSVIVRGSPAAIRSVEKVVRELDQPLRMIEIEVIIATVQVGVAEELGIRWRGSAVAEGGRPRSVAVDSGTSGTQVGNDTTENFDSTGLNALTLLPAAASPNATVASFIVRGAEGVLQAQLRALAEDNRANIISAPRLVTLDNVTARITRSQDLFVQVDTGGDNGQGLDEIQTGLTLEITPSLIPAYSGRGDSLIRLNLSAENSAPGSGAFGQIDVRSQEVQTEVLVPDGGTYVVGGLFDDDRLEQVSGIPLLKDIPGIGQLFRTNVSRKTLGETIFFITPRLIGEDGPYMRDIAQRLGTAGYVRDQRRGLDDVAGAIMSGSGRTFPDAQSRLPGRRTGFEEDE